MNCQLAHDRVVTDCCFRVIDSMRTSCKGARGRTHHHGAEDQGLSAGGFGRSVHSAADCASGRRGSGQRAGQGRGRSAEARQRLHRCPAQRCGGHIDDACAPAGPWSVGGEGDRERQWERQWEREGSHGNRDSGGECDEGSFGFSRSFPAHVTGIFIHERSASIGGAARAGSAGSAGGAPEPAPVDPNSRGAASTLAPTVARQPSP